MKKVLIFMLLIFLPLLSSCKDVFEPTAPKEEEVVIEDGDYYIEFDEIK